MASIFQLVGDRTAPFGAMMLLLSLSSAATAQVPSRDVALGGQDARIAAQAADDVFVSGRRVRVSGTVADTVFAAGEDVGISASTRDDVAALGRSVVITGPTGGNLFAGASELRLPGRVEGDAYLAGRMLRIGPAGINGDLNLFAEQARIEGPVAEKLRASGRKILIDSAVGGDADVAAERLELGPNARIAGMLTLRSDHRPVIHRGAVVSGGIRQLAASSHENRAGAAGIFMSVVIGTVAAWIIGALCFLLAPATLADATSALRREPLRMFVVGLAVAVLALPVIVLLTLSLVGLPFALALGGLWLFAILAAVPVAALGAAILLARRRTGSDSPSRSQILLMLLATSLALAVVGVVPFVGPLLLAVAAIFGVAILAEVALATRRRARLPAAG